LEKLNRVTLLDDKHRPKAKEIEGLTPAQRRQGRRLSLYHNMHRRQLQEVADVMAQVAMGMAEAQSLSRIISDLSMRSNFRTFGNMCGEECQMLSFHHDAEEQGMFPLLQQQGDDPLRKVVERLIAEHKVVHELIEELDARAGALVADPMPTHFAATQSSFIDLEKCVKSHFGYEETELEDALSIIDIGI
jgi:Hemerythrin HHE cation binding domain